MLLESLRIMRQAVSREQLQGRRCAVLETERVCPVRGEQKLYCELEGGACVRIMGR